MTPSDAPKSPLPLISVPTMAVARGRVVGEPLSRHEFRRTDVVVVRVSIIGEPSVSGRLLDRRGQPLTDLPVTPAATAAEVRLPLGNLGPGDYVIELNAKSGSETAQQFVAFRVIR